VSVTVGEHKVLATDQAISSRRRGNIQANKYLTAPRPAGRRFA